MIRRLCHLTLFVLALTLAGCKKPATEAPEPCDKQMVTAAVITTEHINPTIDGAPRPVLLRVYQLKNDVSFRNATFEEVWKEDVELLGEDLLNRQEFPVYPNARKGVEFERNPEAEYVVAAALFREPKGKQWFTTFELPPPPGEEACGVACPEGECAEPADLSLELYIHVDGTRVQDGSDWKDFFPSHAYATQSSTGTNL